MDKGAHAFGEVAMRCPPVMDEGTHPFGEADVCCPTAVEEGVQLVFEGEVWLSTVGDGDLLSEGNVTYSPFTLQIELR